jgi:mono/diheme cytochrome c family protein
MIKQVMVIVVMIGILVLSVAFTKQDIKESIKRGKEVYITDCQSCHLEDGKGTPDINPPLAKADYLKKPAKTLINVILKGQSGEVIVNGKKYNAIMPAQSYLSDQQIADVLNYVRNTWGNKIPGNISPAIVKGNRK